jgi:hypothetical protein
MPAHSDGCGDGAEQDLLNDAGEGAGGRPLPQALGARAAAPGAAPRRVRLRRPRAGPCRPVQEPHPPRRGHCWYSLDLKPSMALCCNLVFGRATQHCALRPKVVILPGKCVPKQQRDLYSICISPFHRCCLSICPAPAGADAAVDCVMQAHGNLISTAGRILCLWRVQTRCSRALTMWTTL